MKRIDYRKRTLFVFLAIMIGLVAGLVGQVSLGVGAHVTARTDVPQEPEVILTGPWAMEFEDPWTTVESAAQQTLLSIDDGSFENALGLTGPGTIWFLNRLQPPSYPATLDQLLIYFRTVGNVPQGAPITLLVGSNPDGDENIDGTAFQELPGTIQTLGQFNAYTVPNMTIQSGDFVVGFRMQVQANVGAGALDTNPPSNRRSYVSTNGSNFTLTENLSGLGGGNLGIRAQVTIQQQPPQGGAEALVAPYLDPNRGDNGTGNLTTLRDLATTPTVGSDIFTQGNTAEVVVPPNGQYAIAYPSGNANSISIITGWSQGNPEESRVIEVGNFPNAVGFTPDSRTAVVVNALTSPITYRIIGGLPDSPAVSGTFSIPNSSNTVAEDIALSPGGDTALITLFNSNAVAVIGSLPGTPTYRGSVGTGAGPNGVAFSPSGNLAYVANTLDNSIEVISVQPGGNASGVRRVFNGVGSNPQGIAVTPDGTKVVVTNTGGSTVSIFQVVGDNLSPLQTLNVGQSPAGLAISPDGRSALVANAGSNTVSVIRGLDTQSPFVGPTLGPSAQFDTTTFVEKSVAFVGSGAPPPTAPDLVVENLSVNPTSTNPGGSVTVNFTILNQGNASAGSASHNIYLSSDANITSGDTLLGAVGTGTLGPGSSQSFNQSVSIPGGTPSGAMFIGVIADANNQVSESNENNNTRSTSITITALQQPDLVVSSLSVNPTSTNPGSTVVVNFTILNQGNTTASSSVANIYLSNDATITTADQQLDSVGVISLGSSGSQSFSRSVLIPGGTSSGSMFIGVIADVSNLVPESNEGNNTQATAITISAPSQPDLVVSALSVNPTSTNPGGTVVVSFTIFNQGNSSAGSASHNIYLSSDSNITSGDTLLTAVGTGTLGPGSSQSFSQSVSIPGGTPSGSMFIGVIADANNQVSESIENNNTRSTPITITVLQQADLVVSSLSINPISTNPGGTVVVSFTIFNQGNASAGSASHNIYLSSDSNITSGDTLLGAVGTGTLGPGSSQSFSQSVSIPGGTPSGSMFIGVIADANNQVSESIENNNTRSTPITITVLQQADLVVSSLSISPTSTNPGGTVVVNFTILNQGNATAGSSVANVYLSNDATITTADQQLDSVGVISLGAGGSQSFSRSVLIPGGTSPGSMFIGVIADVSNLVPESNEGNNTRATSITISSIQDANEPNDGPQQATLLSVPAPGQSSSISGNATTSDAGTTISEMGNPCRPNQSIQDWFRLNVSQRSAFGASLSFAGGDVDFDLFLFIQNNNTSLYPQSVQLIGVGLAGVGQAETLSNQVLEPGTYYIGVSRATSSNAARVSYTLTLTRGASPELHAIEDVACTFTPVSNPIVNGYYIVNRVQPTQYPARLDEIRILFSAVSGFPSPSGRSVRFIVFADPAGGASPPPNPTLLVNQTTTVNLPGGQPTFNSLNVSASNLVINSGVFYVGYVVETANGTLPNAGGVIYPGVRSFFSSTSGLSYQGLNLTNPSTGQLFNVAIRAIVNTRPFGKTSVDSASDWLTRESIPVLVPRDTILEVR